ncbi:hypothetical protein, variant [Fonticula alba]|nr:hypothetical protein, variant [Fonticula alba]KCV73110.1 hypothetical protein, variant [Fonticula alba]|eukprot:XP_009492811.1 hypothetical protein, variant [Fonticula alba]
MLSKCLSYAMLLSGAIIKVPQILIILKNRRAAGLSLMSLVMELVCYSISITYSYRRGFAFSSYGETALIAVQDISLIFLVLALSNRLGLLALSPVLLGLWGAFMFFATGDMLKLMQSATIPVLLLSRLPQIISNFRNGHTGDLSAIGVFAFCIGPLARIFTTLKEANDPIILLGFALSLLVNGTLAAQMIYYWNSRPAAQKED